MSLLIEDPKTLDANGRCCGRKPLRYKRDHPPCKAPFLFCPRCDCAFDDSGRQIENWAWHQRGDQFVWVRSRVPAAGGRA